MPKNSKVDRLCFVVGPIGDDDSEDRIHADWLLEEIIAPIFREHFSDYRVERADRIAIPGRIDAQVITALLDADLVIADLTTLNPNAFYEIGIRHMVQKPIIHMHLEGQRIPFDIASFRSIKFSRTRPRDLRQAREALQEAVAAAVSVDHQVDNPVTFARGKMHFQESATPAQKLVQEQIDGIQRKLATIEDGRRTFTWPAPSRSFSDVIQSELEFKSFIHDNPDENSYVSALLVEHKNTKIDPKDGVRIAFIPGEIYDRTLFRGFVAFQMVRIFRNFQTMTAVNNEEVFRVSNDHDVANGRRAILKAAKAAGISMQIEIRD